MQSSWLGLDIGGANCKFASSDGDAWSVPFPLWKDPTGLVELLRAETSKFSSSHRLAGLAVTMTGELADCYRTKSEGVTHILNSVPTHADWEVKIFRTDGRWATLTEAHADLSNVPPPTGWHSEHWSRVRWVAEISCLSIWARQQRTSSRSGPEMSWFRVRMIQNDCPTTS